MKIVEGKVGFVMKLLEFGLIQEDSDMPGRNLEYDILREVAKTLQKNFDETTDVPPKYDAIFMANIEDILS